MEPATNSSSEALKHQEPDLSPKTPKKDNKQKDQPAVEPKQELKEAIQGSNEVLMTATTVFPMTLFPDTVTVDRSKLTVTKRSFFMVSEVMSIRIEDILNITANAGPFFGSIKISNRVFNNDVDKPYNVNYFWREDALKLKRIIQGYVIALRKDIDCSALKTKELAVMLDQLGKDNHQG
jgi:hypothetical protein